MTESSDRNDVYESLIASAGLADSQRFKDIDAQPIIPPIQACDGLNTWSRDHVACIARYICQPSYTFAGTARMGLDGSSVLDDQLRVRGVEGLRVADLSASPSLEKINTIAIALAIGEKAAEMIKQDWYG